LPILVDAMVSSRSRRDETVIAYGAIALAAAKELHTYAAHCSVEPATRTTLQTFEEQAMARATPTRSIDAPQDAIALLKQDHRMVEALFEEFQDADESEQMALATRICQMLTVHAQIEEELLYPKAKEAFDEEQDEMVYEAEIEHNAAKDLIAKIEAGTPDDPQFKPMVTVLCEYVKHHVKEEEKEMFPALKDTDIDLKDLGRQLAHRKLELMEEMGIEAEEPPAPRKRAATSRSRTSTAKSRQARAGSRSKSSRQTASRARH
jgi:hemerythrin superfamily protein